MEFDLSVRIGRPPEAVYAMLADIQQYVDPASVVPEMEKIPPGPTEVGTRWREVVRLLPGITMTIWSEVVALEPGRRLEVRFHGPGMSGLLIYVIEDHDGGTLLRQIETLTPHGPLRVMAGTVERTLRPRLIARLADIGDRLEREGTGDMTVPDGPAKPRSSMRRLRWSLAIIAVVGELALFVGWRLWGSRRSAVLSAGSGH